MGAAQAERLGRRHKPLKRGTLALSTRAILVRPEDGPVVIDSVEKDGRRVVRITPAQDCGCCKSA